MSGLARSPAIGPSRTSSPSCPGPRPAPTSPSTRRGPRRACRAPIRSCRSAATGLTVEDIDGNLFLDFAAGIAVNSTGHSHPQVVAAIKEQAAELIHFSASDFYLPIYPEVCRRLAELAPIAGRGADVPRQLGGRGRRGVDQARPLRDAPAVRRRLPGRVPRPDLRRRLADRLEGQVPRRVRAAAARRLPRAVRAGRGPALVRRGPVRQAGAGQRGRGHHRRADPGRGRLHRPRGRLPAGPPRHLRPARHPAHRRRDPVGRRAHRQDVGDRALGRRAGHPADRQGHRLGHAPGGDDRPRGPARDHGGPGAHGSTYGGNPVACAASLATIDLLEGGLIANAAVRGEQALAGLRPLIEPVRRPGHGRPRQGPDARRRVRHGRARRGGPVGLLRSAACWSSSAASRACGCRRR